MNIFVVGSGFSGSVAARALAEKGHAVKVIEKLPHIGGNAYDYVDEGIIVHKYGPHIYHTNSDVVHAFLSRFTKWTPYTHRVLGRVGDKEVPIPFNLTSLKMCFGKVEAEYIQGILLSEYGAGTKAPVLELRAHKNKTVRKLGDFVYQNIFYNYTLKQWGKPPEKLNAEAMKRVPVYIGTEDRYFVDKYQFMPTDGYTRIFKNLLAHKNIEVVTNTDALELLKLSNGEVIFDGQKRTADVFIFTGCIDRLFGFKYGALQYRTLDFLFERHAKASYQSAAVVNYPNDERFTRISEFSKFSSPAQAHTIIVKEYPSAHIPDKTLPYYPIEIKQNTDIYNLYKTELEGYKNVYAIGRLAAYKYINMDAAVLGALTLAERL
jgi:UDP-galactopyranose mutase